MASFSCNLLHFLMILSIVTCYFTLSETPGSKNDGILDFYFKYPSLKLDCLLSGVAEEFDLNVADYNSS